jgi:lipoprotein NlpI
MRIAVSILSLLLQSTWQEWNRRGEDQFRRAEIDESIRSFDRAIAMEPRLAPHHWQRGISLYYAERWKDCARQFESHRTVNPEDVENAVWHYLCVARIEGREAARKKLITVRADDRVPMAQIHQLFAGTIEPPAVLDAAGQDGNGRFYAHLYLGLYFESEGDPMRAKSHMIEAAGAADSRHYMGDVARVHVKVRKWAASTAGLPRPASSRPWSHPAASPGRNTSDSRPPAD